MLQSPLLVFAITFVLLCLSAQIGAHIRRIHGAPGEDERQDLSIILTASLTLLGLVIGFSFSMAITRYDQRKNYEEVEANSIGTEYFRATLLPSHEATTTRRLLSAYLNQRISFYTTGDAAQLEQIGAETIRLQAELWSVVTAVAALQPTAISALSVSGLNDVFNSQGYTQAAWWNRIPESAWGLMGAMAICCNLLFGYTARHAQRRYKFLLILPLIVAISFSMICDLDSPRGGVIKVTPQNLVSLSRSIRQL
jgi:hypothetical protein